MAYTLTGRKGGTVRFVPFENGVVEKESESYSSSVTSNPVEDGADINDHVNNAAGQLTISGTIVGGDSAINALKAMRESRDIITYTGVTRMANLVFTSLKFDRSYKNRNGASFSATLKQVKLVSSEFVPMDSEVLMSSQDARQDGQPAVGENRQHGNDHRLPAIGQLCKRGALQGGIRHAEQLCPADAEHGRLRRSGSRIRR